VANATQTHLAAIVRALRFHDTDAQALSSIPERDWPALLVEADQAHLTLALGVRCRDLLPQLVRARIDRNLQDNAARYEKLKAAQLQIADAFAMHKIDFVVLKGLTLFPGYSDDPRYRPQYDIDIYVPAESIAEAAKTVRMLGYEPLTDKRDSGADHLPVMIRKTGWKWQGNYFDPDMPPSLELHYRFWNPQMTRLEVDDVEVFWRRRMPRELDEVTFPALCTVDGLSYAALHLIRHRLIGDMQLRHIYEIAHFLERSASDNAFWQEWRGSGLPSCRVLEGTAFRLASEWFHCAMHPAAADAIELLPAGIKRWFRIFGDTRGPAAGPRDKNELWLHFCLLRSSRDRREIAWRRLFPARQSRVLLHAHVPPAELSVLLRIKRAAFEISFLAARALHHIRALGPALRNAYLWWRAPAE
jgi:hypothetical protein